MGTLFVALHDFFIDQGPVLDTLLVPTNDEDDIENGEARASVFNPFDGRIKLFDSDSGTFLRMKLNSKEFDETVKRAHVIQ